jgi:hypothetical protein
MPYLECGLKNSKISDMPITASAIGQPHSYSASIEKF